MPYLDEYDNDHADEIYGSHGEYSCDHEESDDGGDECDSPEVQREGRDATSIRTASFITREASVAGGKDTT